METITQTLRRAQGNVQSPSTVSPNQSLRVARQDAIAGNNPLSVFRALPPATNQDVMPHILRLAVNFPAMNTAYTAGAGNAQITFWTVLAEQIIALGWSAERVRYAVEYMLRNCPFREFRVAEFLQLDKNVHEIDNAEFAAINRSNAPHKPIVAVRIDGRYKLIYQDDADALGITDYKRHYTTWEAEQMTPEERKQKCIYWMD